MPSVVEDPLTLVADDSAPIVATAMPALQADILPDINHDIISMLERETDLGSFTFDPNSETNQAPAISTYAARPAIVALEPISRLIYSPFINDRVKNYRYFSYTHINLKVKWNVNPFVVGKIGFFWTPDGLNLTQLNLAGLTAYPGMIADVNTSSSLEIQIPWSYPTKALDLANEALTTFTNVRAYLRVILPIRAASAFNMAFRVYGQFVGPKLSGPTLFRLAYRTRPPELTGDEDEDGEIAVTQANVDVKESESAAKSFSVSNILKSGSAFAGSLAQVPVIGRWAGIASSVTSFLGEKAAAFGFSKHFNVTPLQKVMNMPFYGMNNSDGDDVSVALSHLRQPAVEHGSYSWATDLDEMTVSHIGEREACIYEESWPESTAADTVIFQDIVSVSGADTSALVYSPTPGEYIAMKFRFARFKSIIYKFDFAKTPFHNGVLEVGFTYNTGSAFPTNTQQILYTMIVDVLNRKEFEVEIPFMYNKQWINPFEEIGTLYLKVISPLISNPNVPDQIDYVVTKRFEGLALDWYLESQNLIPSNPTFTGIDLEALPPGMAPAPPRDEDENDEVAFTQINLAVNTDCVRLVCGTPMDVHPDVVSSTTGEMVLSIRKLLKGFWKLIFNFNAPASGPFISLDHVNLIARTPQINYFSKLYFYYRGGIRIKVHSSNVSTLAGLRFSNSRLANVIGGVSHYVVDTVLTRSLQFILPFYGQVPFRLLRPTALNDAGLRALNGIIPVFTCSDTANFAVYSALGEDFSFFGLKGAPLVTVAPATNSWTRNYQLGISSYNNPPTVDVPNPPAPSLVEDAEFNSSDDSTCESL